MPTEHRQEQRRRILDAAIRCFVQRGFHATSMQQLCSAAGMSPGSVYRYFPSKEAIIEAISAEDREAVRAILLSVSPDPSVLTMLSSVARQFLVAARERLSFRLCPEVFAEALRNPQIKTFYDQQEQLNCTLLQQLLEHGIASGELDPVLPIELTLQLSTALADGLLLRLLLRPELSVDELLPQVQLLLQRYLRHPTSPT